jgi:hypothetical protein
MKTLRVNNDEILVDENRARPKPFHSPAEALETHCDLLDWIDAEEGFAFTRDIVLKHRTNYGLDDEGNEVQTDDEGIVEGYRSALWEAVNQNNTMYVSAHMCDQLQALIPTFEDEPLWETDLPDQRGTVLFEAAIRATISDSRATTSQYPNDDQIDYWIKGFVYRRVWDSTIEVTRNGVYLRINVAAPPTDDAASGSSCGRSSMPARCSSRRGSGKPMAARPCCRCRSALSRSGRGSTPRRTPAPTSTRCASWW